jgi:hypothetical protein
LLVTLVSWRGCFFFSLQTSFCLWGALGFELRASCWLSRCSYGLIHPASPPNMFFSLYHPMMAKISWDIIFTETGVFFIWLLLFSPPPLFFFFFCSTGVWTQGFILARQALYHLSHVPSPFGFDCFRNKVLLFARGRPGPLFTLPAVAGIHACATCPVTFFLYFKIDSYLSNS